MTLRAAPLFTKYLDVFEGLIAEGQRQGAVRPDLSPRVASRALWGALDGVAVTWAIGGGEPGALARAARQVGDVFLSGVLAR